jgi:hypothetical protein
VYAYAVLQGCYSGVTVALKRCYSGVTVVLQWCHSGVTSGQPPRTCAWQTTCYPRPECTTVSEWCYRWIAVVFQRC